MGRFFSLTLYVHITFIEKIRKLGTLGRKESEMDYILYSFLKEHVFVSTLICLGRNVENLQ